jgi:hypothetical protein
MGNSDIGKTATRLRWAVWIFWACVLLAYAVGRFGLTFGVVEVQAHSVAGDTPAFMVLADISVLLLSVALYQLARMLGAIAEGDLFSARVVKAFRSFAFWLLLVALVWIVAPVVAVLLAGPGDAHRMEFRLQMRDVLTVGIALILFLVARLLERARTVDEELREIV